MSEVSVTRMLEGEAHAELCSLSTSYRSRDSSCRGPRALGELKQVTKPGENGNLRRVIFRVILQWLVFMLSLRGSQYWLHIHHLGKVLENTHAWSHTESIVSESLGGGVQMPVYFRSFLHYSHGHWECGMG